MNFDTFLSRMDSAGDAYIFFKTSNSPREKYHIGTLDFSTRYIADKKANEVFRTTEVPDNHVKIFCWDSDNFKLLDVRKVVKVIPLNMMVKQNPDMRV